jgi:hypothetical protein
MNYRKVRACVDTGASTTVMSLKVCHKPSVTPNFAPLAASARTLNRPSHTIPPLSDVLPFLSIQMARECGLMPHVDTSVVGGVKGVGFAKILGCVHDARIRYPPHPPTAARHNTST